MKKMALMLASGIGAALLGLPYIFHAFGPTEAEVVSWGEVSLYTGIVLAFLSVGIGWSNHIVARVVLAIGYIFLVLLQVLPILLWFAFHGTGISDGTPPSTFVARWWYAIPHLGLLIAGLVVLYMLVRGKPRLAS